MGQVEESIIIWTVFHKGGAIISMVLLDIPHPLSIVDKIRFVQHFIGLQILNLYNEFKIMKLRVRQKA